VILTQTVIELPSVICYGGQFFGSWCIYLHTAIQPFSAPVERIFQQVVMWSCGQIGYAY